VFWVTMGLSHRTGRAKSDGLRAKVDMAYWYRFLTTLVLRKGPSSSYGVEMDDGTPLDLNSSFADLQAPWVAGLGALPAGRFRVTVDDGGIR
jgi:hypothetical protein